MIFCLFLIRASLELRFAGIIPFVIVFSLIPALVEAVLTATLSQIFFGMPLSLSYALGFILAHVSTGVSLPLVYSIVARGFKINPIIPNCLIFTTTFDDLSISVVAACFKQIALDDNSDVS